jgi:CRISPR/Cas system Type II protein with McrA/HNH and RuvC-like nuclease domain
MNGESEDQILSELSDPKLQEEFYKLGFTKTSLAVAIRAKFKCEYCGLDLITDEYTYELFQIDHIYPQSKVDLELFNNYALSCRLCNRLKRNHEYGERLSNPRASLDIIKAKIQHKLQLEKEEIQRLKGLYEQVSSKK